MSKPKKPGFRPDPAAAEVGRRIRRLLRKRGITQLGLAERMGMSSGGLSLTLSGKRGVTVRTLARIAEALGCRLDVRFTSERTLEVGGLDAADFEARSSAGCWCMASF